MHLYDALMFLVRHLILPVTLCIWLWKREYHSESDRMMMSLLTGGFVFYIFLAGQWHAIGYGVRLMLPLVFALALAGSFYRNRSLPVWHKRNPKEWFAALIMSLFIVIFAAMAVWSYLGKTHEKTPIEASFPFRNGDFAILDGGNSPIINSLHRYPDIPDKFSIKIGRLSKVGKHSTGFFPVDSSSYHILGDTVYSPVNGIVTHAVDGIDPLDLSWSDSLDSNVSGNQIRIRQQDVIWVLNHLMKNSLMVEEGDTIRIGTALARVGNSGYIEEPLLHIYAYREGDFPPWEGRGLPIHFDGNFLVRNDVVRKR